MTDETQRRSGQQRASDNDRDQAAAVLGDALATGRLDRNEYGERLGSAYSAKTLGDLAQITCDLPAPSESGSGVVRPPVQRIQVTLGRMERRLLLKPGDHVAVSARLGNVRLDLRGLPPGDEPVVITVDSLLSQVEMMVAGDARVMDFGQTYLGQRTVASAAGGGGGGLIHLRGETRLSQLRVVRDSQWWRAWRWKATFGR